MKSKEWDLGYKYGSTSNLNKVVPTPIGLGVVGRKEWLKGCDAAISDRLG